MRILIVDDDRIVRNNLLQHLVLEGYSVDAASTSEEALEQIGSNEYDCILLDLNLPDGDGLNILRELKREKKECGVIILSSRTETEDRISGLNLGADDYIPKPFSMRELSARINAVLRRRFKQPENVLRVENLEIHFDSHIVKVDGKDVDLTRNEYSILRYLAFNRNKPVTRSAIAEHVMGNKVDDLSSLDFLNSHIKNIRKKIMAVGGRDFIKTVHGVGYKFDAK